jgi:hypothetical protein
VFSLVHYTKLDTCTYLLEKGVFLCVCWQFSSKSVLFILCAQVSFAIGLLKKGVAGGMLSGMLFQSRLNIKVIINIYVPVPRRLNIKVIINIYAPVPRLNIKVIINIYVPVPRLNIKVIINIYVPVPRLNIKVFINIYAPVPRLNIEHLFQECCSSTPA